jgi:hypothetical protein
MTDFTIYEVDLDTQRPNPADNTKVLRGDPPRTAFSKYNDLLLALQGAVPHVGIEAPNPTVPFMKWFDTSVSPPVERYRNSANTAWLLSNPLATTNSDGWMSKADKAKLDGVQSNAYLLNRANHTGTQAIGTVSGLQTALDNVAAASVAQTDVGSGPDQVPSNQHLGALAFMDAVGVVQATQHTPDAKPGSSWKQISGNGFTEKFVDPSGNIIDVTPQTVPGALAQMQGFGIGAVTGPSITDLNALRNAGMYVATVAASTASGLPLSLGHTIIHASGSTGAAMQFASPITTGAGNRWRLWHRQMIADGWSSWRELAFLESPAFTGAPSAPNLKFGNTASADVNTLDHYEEGTFTPALYGATTAGSPSYSARFGRYTRIGNRVSWTMRLALSAVGGMAGSMRLSGLPFINANVSGGDSSINFGFYAGIQAGVDAVGVSGLTRVNFSEANIYKASATNRNVAALLASEITDAFTIYASGHYEV